MNEQALKDRLQAISKEKGIQFNECWKKLLLEKFLFRLSRSAHTQKFIFKGGSLLAYLMEIGRETTDLDFLLTSMNASEDEIRRAITEIIAPGSEDAQTQGGISLPLFIGLRIHPHPNPRSPLPLMHFLFVRSAFCIRLSSDSTSRWTPLPSLTALLTRARKGLSPSSLTTYRSHGVR